MEDAFVRKLIKKLNVEDLVGQDVLLLIFSLIAVVIMTGVSCKSLPVLSYKTVMPVILGNLVPTLITFSFGVICQCIAENNISSDVKTCIVFLFISCVVYSAIYFFVYDSPDISFWGSLIILFATPFFISINFESAMITSEMKKELSLSSEKF